VQDISMHLLDALETGERGRMPTPEPDGVTVAGD
jgi:hypothetical protein